MRGSLVPSRNPRSRVSTSTGAMSLPS
jgi:hypothetical protein